MIIIGWRLFQNHDGWWEINPELTWEGVYKMCFLLCGLMYVFFLYFLLNCTPTLSKWNNKNSEDWIQVALKLSI